MEYKERNGTFYNPATSDQMIDLLEAIRLKGIRVRFHWGDVETGHDWGECMNCTGKIGRSMGPKKIPILIYNKRSLGGGAILTDCIVKITTTKGNKTLYQHENYHV